MPHFLNNHWADWLQTWWGRYIRCALTNEKHKTNFLAGSSKSSFKDPESSFSDFNAQEKQNHAKRAGSEVALATAPTSLKCLNGL